MKHEHFQPTENHKGEKSCFHTSVFKNGGAKITYYFQTVRIHSSNITRLSRISLILDISDVLFRQKKLLSQYLFISLSSNNDCFCL